MTNGAKKEKNIKDIDIGTIVEISWLDAQHFERLTWKDFSETKDPSPTKTYGIIGKHSEGGIWLIHEYSADKHSDSIWLTFIPYGMIVEISTKGKTNLEEIIYKNLYHDEECCL